MRPPSQIEFPAAGPLGIYMDSFTVRYNDGADEGTLHCCIVRESSATNVEPGDILVHVNGQKLIAHSHLDEEGAKKHDDYVTSAIRTAATPRIVRFYKSPEIDPKAAGATLSYNDALILLSQL